MNQFETFLQLHKQATPLLLGNCWDVSSAKILEAAGFKAIATSSMAVAQSLGYNDGQHMPFELLLATAKRIQQNITVPFSVDLERGYSTTIKGIIQNIVQLHDIGVAGINLEDSANGTMEAAPAFAKTISGIANYLAQKNIPLFINARTDAFLVKLPDALEETLQRIKVYENTGASGIFVPFIKNESDIKSIVAATTLPVNILPVPGLPDMATLTAIGVKRISLGSALFNAYKTQTTNTIRLIMQQQSFEPLF
ncbi:isocitrate lyase/PEP mutase family protein [Ferruginibacter profundus]